MSENLPTLDIFKTQMETLLGQSLTDRASQAAEDFWEHWSSFSSLIGERSLVVNVDMLRLGMNFPQYKRYHIWKGAGKVLILLGIVAAWLFWQLGVFFIVAGVGLHFWGGRVRIRDAQKFSEELIEQATLHPSDGGSAKLCAHYVSGTIQLASPNGSAHWPQFPSNAVTGKQDFISP